MTSAKIYSSKMKLTPIQPLQPPTPDIHRTSNSSIHPNSQSETLSSLCDWWKNTKKEALPGICHWFIHPEKNQIRINFDQARNVSSFSSIGHSSSVGISDLDHSLYSTSSISLILIIGCVLFLLLITALITCITRRKWIQPSNEEDLLNQRISNHIQRITSSNMLHMMERSNSSEKKDHPPDYVSVIKMKEKEDEDLPTYSEAITIETGRNKLANIDGK